MRILIFFLALAATIFVGCLDRPVDQAELDRSIITDYIAANNLNAIEDDSGLFYVVDVPGSEEKPTATDSVIMTYRGYLVDGGEFDGTDPGEVARFKLNQLIAGWQIGIPKFGRGGSGVLLIPSALGYGRQPLPGIPANSVLIFDIGLEDFK